MKPIVRLGREAQAELRAAIEWYEEQRTELGEYFWREVDRALSLLADSPSAGTTVPGVHPQAPVRRVFVRKFPYALVYLTYKAEIRVIAVTHLRRKPRYWLSRVK
jgi:toxin ParE1/3/4